jgi:two-component system CheB/CheR fusion protein
LLNITPEHARPAPVGHVAQSILAVIGIGASAGGLEAVTRLIKAWPPEASTAFILVQHADPSGGSMMAALLAPHTELTVLEASDKTPVAPGHLYIIPPGRYLSVADGVLHVSAPPSHGARMPFDFLLHSLAEQYGNRAACIVLSGTGTDGTIGVARIKAQGGIVAVQDPMEAGYDGMPTSAVATGMADFVLPIAEIPAALSARLRSVTLELGTVPASGAAPRATAPDVKVTGNGLPDIIELLRAETGNDFTLYKPGTLQRRIGRRIALAGLKLDDTAGYTTMLRADPTELQALSRDLLIHVTSFFRDGAVFDTLATDTIPELVASHPADQPMRVWVAGCSTGEETYSLAMLFLEQIEAGGSPVKLQVFASDVDAEAIAAARDGTYPASIEGTVTAARLARFFVREKAGWRATPNLRASIVFTVQDVLADPPFSRLDMVSCRNLLIYLRPDAQARVLEAFHFALRPGGILLLGSAENAISPEGRFEATAKGERIFRRVGRGPAGAPGSPARVGPHPHLELVRPGEERRPRAVALLAAPLRPAVLAELGRRLVMEDYAPASVLVDAANAVLFGLGPTDRYLRLPAGSATQDLLTMARSGLRAKLRAALQAARAGQERVQSAGWIAKDGVSQPFKLVVRPVNELGQHDLMLVCFMDATPPEEIADVALSHIDAPQFADLQRELDATRTELQGTVRDLELSGEEQRAINEEALSVNEEYQSTNEELVASKEELQSLNEELTAVNSQLQETLERQRTTSDDLQNVLFSTNVATLFLDLDGRIRFFTPAIKALFDIIPDDVGRKLAAFAALAPDAALAGDVTAVQNGLEPPDREIQALDGAWFRRRILPYRASGGRVEGVVITFTNITARKAAGRALEAAKMEAEAANAAKTRFLAAASHDLRQPLQTLALLQALLADTVSGEKAQSLVARQSVTLSTVTGMLDTLLDINEIEAGAVQPDIATFPIGELLERMRSEFTYPAAAKGIELRVVACGQHVRSDRRLLEQMIRNLLSNAIKYTAKGGVLLGCRRHISNEAGDTLSLEVLDTGIGIEKANLTAIFDEYYQVGNAARQRSRGLGLGLSIVKRLGDLLTHPIHVRSHPGSGSMFTIELPWLPQGETKRSIRPAPKAPEASDGLRILVVEDDPDVGEMLGELLTGQGHDVMAAPDGPAALDLIAHGVNDLVPDLVIADYNLPNGPNGLELAKMIRTAAGHAVPVLILTGDISNATRRAVAEAGCGLLSKPAALPALREAIAHLLAPPTGAGQPVVFVVDDDDEVRGAILAVLEADGRTASGYPSGEAFLQAFRPGDGDCLLIDAALPGISGVELLEQLREAGHGLPVIVVTGQSDVPMAIRAMKAGASDFIEKPVSRAGLLASVVHALEGSHDAAKLVERHDAAAAMVAGLTRRQREIMDLVLAGHPSKNIASDLGISQRTVENHRASIMHRTGTTSLPALARLALAAGASVA